MITLKGKSGDIDLGTSSQQQTSRKVKMSILMLTLGITLLRLFDT